METSKELLTPSLLAEIETITKHAKEIATSNFFYDTGSPETDKITKALCDFVLDMPKLLKDSNAMGRYKYQGLPAMLDQINPVLAKFGLKCSQPPHSIGETTYIVTKILHTSGQYLRCVTALPKEYSMAGKLTTTDQNLQAMGGAQTYVKRHALKGILGIDADDDTDGGTTAPQPTPQPQRQNIFVQKQPYGPKNV